MSNRRDEPRVPVEWRAECKLGANLTQGLVRDVSGGGVFFTPVLPSTNGDDARMKVLSFMEPGDTVVLTYRPEWREQPMMVLATVQWVGYSHDNEIDGVGLHFQRD
ncbi:MAG: PilZ domain-containing protein [Deltaproteobacteria bacterium]|nr:PilZ domain-containing protein [Deltaproteobacteria bacterium]